MIKTVRTNSKNKDFIELIKKLDIYLTIIDGDEHQFYDKYNGLNTIKYVVLIYFNNIPVGCGAIKKYGLKIMEIKRMFTLPEYRGKGLASSILSELESWALELGNIKCILETGKKQKDAVSLYKKNGYTLIPNYGQYAKAENSFCFQKQIQ